MAGAMLPNAQTQLLSATRLLAAVLGAHQSSLRRAEETALLGAHQSSLQRAKESSMLEAH